MALLWTHSNSSTSCVGNPRAGHSTKDEILQGQNREGQSPPFCARHPCFDAVQLAFYIACTHCCLMSSFSSTRAPKSFSTGLLSGYYSPSLYTYLGLAQPNSNALHLAILNLIRFSLACFLNLIPLDCISSFCCFDCTTQLDVFCKLADGALNPTVYVIDKDVKEHLVHGAP